MEYIFLIRKKTLSLFVLYSLVFNYIQLFSDRDFDFNDTELDIDDELCLSLILDLFNAKYKGNIILLLSIFILKYKYFKNKFKDIKKECIIGVFNNIYSKYGKRINAYKNEDILLLICEEINSININVEKSSQAKSNYNDLNKKIIKNNILHANQIDNNKNDLEKEIISDKIKIISNNKNEYLEINNSDKNININEFWDKKILFCKNGINEIFKKILNKMKLDDDDKDYLSGQFNELKKFLLI